jgi:mRNA interferase RelE/StbE
MYSIELKSQPQKFIRRQPKDIQERILNKIESLKDDPFPPQSARLREDPNLHRIRTGDYRIIYHVQRQENHIVITKVGHRKNVYDSL